MLGIQDKRWNAWIGGWLATFILPLSLGANDPDEKRKEIESAVESLGSKVSSAVDTLTDERADFEYREMEALVAAVREATALDEAEAAPLLKAARKAVDASEAAWKTAFADELRRRMIHEGMQAEATSLPGSLELFIYKLIREAKRDARVLLTPDWVRPQASGLWEAALAEVLDARQLEAWEAELTKQSAAKNARLSAIATRTAEACRPPLEVSLEEITNRLIEAMGIEGDRLQELERLVEKTLESRLKSVAGSARDHLENQLPLFDLRVLLDDPESVLGSVVRSETKPGRQRLDQSQTWRDGLAGILTDDELATWQRTDAEFWAARETEKDEEAERLVAQFSERYRPGFEALVEKELREILNAIDLSGEREAALHRAARSSVEQTIQSWEEGALEHLAEMNEPNRLQAVQRSHLDFSASSVTPPEKRQTWTSAVEQILTPAERETLKRSIASRAKSKLSAVSGIALAAVHDELFLSLDQIERLQPAFEEVIKRAMSRNLERNRIQLNHSVMISALRRKEFLDEAGEILSPAQDTALRRLIGSRTTSRLPRVNISNETDLATTPVTQVSERDVEEVISRYMALRIEREHRDRFTTLASQIDGMARTIPLSPETRRRLEIAAKGAVTQETERLAQSMPDYLRGQFKRNRRNQKVQDLLNRFGNYRANSEPAIAREVWRTALERDLTEKERDRWTELRAEVNQWRYQRIAHYVLAWLDADLSLSELQWALLEERIGTILGTYGDTLEVRFRRTTIPWYLSGRNALLPVAAIPQDTLEEWFDPEQAQLWRKRYGDRLDSQWRAVEYLHEKP